MTDTVYSLQKHIEELRKMYNLPETDGAEIKRHPIDYGYCVPGCEICQGVGLIASDDGGWTACPNNPRRFYNSGVSESDAQLWKVLPQKTKAVERIMDALNAVLQARKGFVYIHGTPGIGKTVCARAFTVEAIQAGMRALYTRQSEMTDQLRASYDAEHGQEEYQTRLRFYKDMDWLTIDELGRDRMNDFARKTLAEIIDARYTSALSRNKVTILVSNFSPEEIFPAYIVDRVRDKQNVVLALQGRSLRL